MIKVKKLMDLSVFTIMHLIVFYVARSIVSIEINFIMPILIVNTLLFLREFSIRKESVGGLWAILVRSTWNKLVFVTSLAVFYLWELLRPQYLLEMIHPLMPFIWILIGFPVAYLMFFQFSERG